VLRPNALSARSTVCRVGSSSSAVNSDDSAGGISESRREVKISSNLATCSVFLVLRTEESASQAGAPNVLPPRWISVRFSAALRGARWDSMCSGLSSLRARPDSVKTSADAIVVECSWFAYRREE